MKKCCSCGVRKKLCDFRKNKGKKDGHSGMCKNCAKEYERKYNSSGRAVWIGMLKRCNDPKEAAYPYYGGRGIKVCPRWIRLENFLADMGIRPEGKTLDRIDNDKGYEPSNCRWATSKEQQNNRRDNIVFEFNGVRLTISQWEEQTGIHRSTILYRVRAGWSVEKILSKKSTKIVNKKRIYE